jgi:hypothetical protein
MVAVSRLTVNHNRYFTPKENILQSSFILLYLTVCLVSRVRQIYVKYNVKNEIVSLHFT